MTALTSALASLTYTHITYRLSGKIQINIFQAVQTILKNAPFPNSIDFACSKGSLAEQANCDKFYAADFNAEEKPYYVLDMIVYNQEEVLLDMKTALIQSYDCWTSSGRFRFRENKLIINTQFSPLCSDIEDKSSINDLFLVDFNSNHIMTKLNATESGIINGTNTYIFECAYIGHTCTVLKTGKYSLAVQSYADGFYYVNYVDTQEFTQNQQTVLTGNIIGGVICAGCITLCVMKMVKTHKILAQTKKEGKRKIQMEA
ncbi:Conserved_hypothetical protein [Hexamita inflata]|uniref:Uncharacterized protein n=1 Tax=Hexamita inflata TaxID=28002 RepID=A0AA86U5Q0_9EUKA|nr:Conserved hypothetical protein [Hexamita inflata]